MTEYRSKFADLEKQFVTFRKASGSWNDVTYGLNLKLFDHYCYKYHPEKELCQDIVDEWCVKRSTENNSSYNTRTAIIREFIVYLNARKLTEIRPPDTLKGEKRKHLPHDFTETELRNFFYECDHIQSAYSMRYSSIIRRMTCPVFFRLLFSSGIRTTEARLLRRTDVDLEHGVLNIQQSKGYDQHYVALHSTMTALLKEFDDAIQKIQPDRTYFFESTKGDHYSKDWVADNFSALWKKANPGVKNTVAYDLRHHYAITNINSWNGDAFEFHDKLHFLSKSMGHRWIVSTLYYYTIVPKLADLLQKKTEIGFNEIIPEVSYEEKL